MLIEYAMTHENAIPPQRANPSDAGLDLFANMEDEKSIVIKSGESVLVQSGIRIGIPHGYAGIVQNRSSVAYKKSLIVGACVIDSGYDQEVFINLHNIGSKQQEIKFGDKIAQFLLIPAVPFRAIESGEGDLYDWYPITISNRDGGFGSTGN